MSENDEEIDDDEPIEIRLENAVKENEIKEKNLKDLQKQLKDLQSESESTKRELEKTKTTNKRLVDENKQLKDSHAQSQRDLKTQNQLLTRQNEQLENNSALGMTRRDEELCKIVLKETYSFKNFVEAINMHLMPDSLELPRIYGQLADRQEKVSFKNKFYLPYFWIFDLKVYNIFYTFKIRLNKYCRNHLDFEKQSKSRI